MPLESDSSLSALRTLVAAFIADAAAAVLDCVGFFGTFNFFELPPLFAVFNDIFCHPKLIVRFNSKEISVYLTCATQCEPNTPTRIKGCLYS